MKPRSICRRSRSAFIPRSIQSIASLPLLVTVGLAVTHSSLFADDVLTWDLPAHSTAASSGSPAVGVIGISGTEMTAQNGTAAASSNETGYWNRMGFAAVDSAVAQTDGDYYAFETTVATGFTATISGIGKSEMRRGGSGSNPDLIVGLFHSSDNITFTQVGSFATIPASTTVDVGAAFNTDLASNNIVMASGEIHYWRMVGYGALDSNSGRLRWAAGPENAPSIDFSFTGMVVSDTPLPNLVWTGSSGNNWDTNALNKSWIDTTNSNAATPFETGNNVTINIPASITVAGVGVSPGTVTVANPSGAVVLTGGGISGYSLTKSDAGSLEIGGTNDFTVGISINGGVLQINSDTALGTYATTLNGGTLAVAAAVGTVSSDFLVAATPSMIDAATAVTFSGVISATGAAANVANQLTKTGAGVLTFANSSGSAIGSQTSYDSTAGQIQLDITGGGVTFDGAGTRHLGGNMTWDAPVILNGGLLQFHGGSVGGTASIELTADSSLRARFNYGTAMVNNDIQVPTGIALRVDSPNGANLLLLSGEISGDGSVSKIGNGEVQIATANSYTGGTTATAGILTISDVGALGTAAATVAGGQLRLEQLAGIVANDLTLSGTNAGFGTIGVGALVVHNDGLASTFSGTVTLAADTRIRSYSAGGAVTFTQPIQGFGNLTIEAGGASTTHNQYWTLQGGASTFTGDVTLRTDGSANAWLTLDGGSLPANSVLTLEDSSIPAVGGNNAVLDLNGQDQTLGGLASISGAGGLGSFVTNSGGSQSTLTIDGVFDHVFGGTIGANAAAALTGQGAGGDDIALVKDGGGTLFLNGVNTYTGDTTILAGKIEFITSNFSNTSTVTLDGGTLSLVNAGTDIVGSLIINGEVQLGAGAIYNEGNTAGAIVGLGEIQVGVVAGSFDAWVTGAPYNLAGANAEPDADPDHDGIANSVEFVVGGNPADMSDTDKLPMGAVVGTKLEFTYRLTDDSAYLNPTVEYGSDLISWTTAEGNVGGVTIGAPTDLGNGVKQIVVAIPMNAEAKRFARLRVVVP